MPKCSKCGAPVLWARYNKTGNPAPIDAGHSNEGSILIIGQTYYIVEPEKRHNYKGLHTPHFQTCPYAKEFRRK